MAPERPDTGRSGGFGDLPGPLEEIWGGAGTIGPAPLLEEAELPVFCALDLETRNNETDLAHFLHHGIRA